jgi:hypothetical protein
MQLIRKNYPVVIAWLAYAISAWLLKKLVGLGTFQLLKLFSFEFSSNSYPFILFLGIVILIAAEYIGYASSVRWVAVPLSLIAKHLSAKPKSGFLILDWLSFCYYFGLFCLPLLVINAFPFISFDVQGLPISKEITEYIGLAWKLTASLFTYRGIVLPYLGDIAKEHSNAREYLATV